MATRHMVSHDVNGVPCDEDGGYRQVDEYPQTPQSIADARAAQLRDREQVYRETGIKVTEDGRFIHMVASECPHCKYQVVGDETYVLSAIKRHLINKHGVLRFAKHARQEAS